MWSPLLLLLLGSPLLCQDPPKPGDVQLERRTVSAASGAKIEAERGFLSVPENRRHPQAKLIRISFVRLRSKAEKPSAPLVYLPGGPGDSSTRDANNPLALERWLPFLAISDVILLDPRGCGASTPSLRWTWDGPLPLDVFVSEEAARTHWHEMSRRARAELLRRGIDLDGYTTVQMADDIDDLRRALKLERISLMGFSFGTHLALAVMRQHGAHIESAVLIGMAGPNHLLRLPLLADKHIGTLSRLAAQDKLAGAPDLERLLKRAMEKLEQQPMTVKVTDRRTGQPVELRIGRFGLSFVLACDLGDTSDVIVFPRLLHDIAEGDPAVLQWFVQKRFPFFQQIDGLLMLVRGASDGSAERRARIAREAKESMLGNAGNFPLSAGEVWNAPDLGEEYRSPVKSNVRTLLVSGTLDWNTPPTQAEEVRQGLIRATHLVVEHAGHEQSFADAGVRAAILDFLKGQDVSHRKLTCPPPQCVPLTGSPSTRTHPAVPKASRGGCLLGAATQAMRSLR
jgi:pimeloyl-ACP methyl ester carboxylesterase